MRSRSNTGRPPRPIRRERQERVNGSMPRTPTSPGPQTPFVRSRSSLCPDWTAMYRACKEPLPTLAVRRREPHPLSADWSPPSRATWFQVRDKPFELEGPAGRPFAIHRGSANDGGRVLPDSPASYRVFDRSVAYLEPHSSTSVPPQG